MMMTKNSGKTNKINNILVIWHSVLTRMSCQKPKLRADFVVTIRRRLVYQLSIQQKQLNLGSFKLQKHCKRLTVSEINKFKVNIFLKITGICLMPQIFCCRKIARLYLAGGKVGNTVLSLRATSPHQLPWFLSGHILPKSYLKNKS